VPQVKTFIDGRMAAWSENGKTPPVIAGDNVFLQKSPITFRKFEIEYDFRWVIVPTKSNIADYLNDLVTNGKWERRYKDEFWSYFVKK
jgi:hypothetical protein